MSFWTRVFGEHAGITPNANSPAPEPGTVSEPDWTPGDPHGLEVEGVEETGETAHRALPFPSPSPWSGWPSEWNTPNFNTQLGFRKLADTAWACLDLNASVLSTMPVYRTQSNEIVFPKTWMSNPDPAIYQSWCEFAKQLFWDYMCGEAFVLAITRGSDGKPNRFRVIPPWMVNAEMRSGRREYTLGRLDVTEDILHIRYASSTDNARGMGPLDVVGARITASLVLQRYANQLAETGGVPNYWITTDKRVNQTEANELVENWIETRRLHPGHPAFLGNGGRLEQSQAMSAKDMALLELAQFNESRIAVLMGVPPFLVGLPGGGDSLVYSNVSQLFDFHDRASLRPKATSVMSALALWLTPHGQSVELNRDEYTRPDLKERAEAYEKLHNIVDADGATALGAREVREMERFRGEAAAAALSGGDATGSSNGTTGVPRVQRNSNVNQ